MGPELPAPYLHFALHQSSSHLSRLLCQHLSSYQLIQSPCQQLSMLIQEPLLAYFLCIMSMAHAAKFSNVHDPSQTSAQVCTIYQPLKAPASMQDKMQDARIPQDCWQGSHKIACN